MLLGCRIRKRCAALLPPPMLFSMAADPRGSALGRVFGCIKTAQAAGHVFNDYRLADRYISRHVARLSIR